MNKPLLVSGGICVIVAALSVGYAIHASRESERRFNDALKEQKTALDNEKKRAEVEAQNKINEAKLKFEYEKRIAELEAEKRLAEAKSELNNASAGGNAEKKPVLLSGRIILDEVFDISVGAKRPFAINLDKGGSVEIALNVMSGPGVGLLLADEIAVQSSVGESSVTFKKKAVLGVGKWSLIACGVQQDGGDVSAKSLLKLMGAAATGQWWAILGAAATEADKDSGKDRVRSRVRLAVAVKDNQEIPTDDISRGAKGVGVEGEFYDPGIIYPYGSLKSIKVMNHSNKRIGSISIEAVYSGKSVELGGNTIHLAFTDKPIEPLETQTFKPRMYNVGVHDGGLSYPESAVKVALKNKADSVALTVKRAFEYVTFE